MSVTDIFGWIDESDDPNPQTEGKFYCGLSLCKTPNSEQVIASALADLRGRDPTTLSPADCETLRRGYYHASLDGPQAHSALCTAVRTLLRPTTVEVISIDKALLRKSGTELTNQRKLHRHLVQLLATPISNQKQVTLNLCVGERAGSFTSPDISTIVDDIYDGLVYSASVNTMLPCHFNRIEVELALGSAFGVQVVDFVLWCVSRHKEYGDRTWLDRLGRWDTAEWSVHNDPMSGFGVEIKEGCDWGDSDLVGTPSPYGEPVDLESINEKEMNDAFIWAEQCVRHAAASVAHFPHLQHLTEYLREANEVSEQNPYGKLKRGVDPVDVIGKAFMMIVDTGPAYLEDDPQGPRMAQIAKKVIGLTRQHDQVNGVMTGDHWRRLRRNIYDHDPTILNPPPENHAEAG